MVKSIRKLKAEAKRLRTKAEMRGLQAEVLKRKAIIKELDSLVK